MNQVSEVLQHASILPFEIQISGNQFNLSGETVFKCKATTISTQQSLKSQFYVPVRFVPNNELEEDSEPKKKENSKQQPTV